MDAELVKEGQKLFSVLYYLQDVYGIDSIKFVQTKAIKSLHITGLEINQYTAVARLVYSLLKCGVKYKGDTTFTLPNDEENSYTLNAALSELFKPLNNNRRNSQ